jgi:hypothetical protein
MWHKVNVIESQGFPTNPLLTGDKLWSCEYNLAGLVGLEQLDG